jgi:hypothetical protein
MCAKYAYAVRVLYVYVHVFYVLVCLYAGARDTAHAIQKFRQLCFIWPNGLGSRGRGGRARSADHRCRQICGQMRVFLARLRLQVGVPRPWSWSCRRAGSEKERKSFAQPVLGWTISVAKMFCPIGLDILQNLLDLVFLACLNHFDKFWLRAKIS